jgi:hypothetical protein
MRIARCGFRFYGSDEVGYGTSVALGSSPDTYDIYETDVDVGEYGRGTDTPIPADPCQIPGDNNMVCVDALGQ